MERSMDSTNCIAGDLKSMINNKMLSDIVLEFECEQKSLYAHKLILSVRSNVFNKMFNGPLSTKNKAIQIKECSCDEFLLILNYCYTDKIQLNRDNVWGVMAAANYYEIIKLEEQCCDLVIEYLNVDNVCEIYETISLFSNKLTAKCLRIIDDNATQIIHKEGFFNFGKSTLEALVARDQLSISEFELYVALKKWITLNNESWDSLWKLIRFPIMTNAEFHRCCQAHGMMFTGQQIEDTKCFIKTGHAPPGLSFSTVKRKIYLNWEYEFYFDCGLLFNWNDEIEVNNLNLTVRQKTEITRFDFVCCENNLDDSIVYGIELSDSDDGSIFYENESLKSFIDSHNDDSIITLVPNVTYTVTSWVKWESKHSKRSLYHEARSCTFDMSEVPFISHDDIRIIYTGDNLTFISRITYKVLK